MWLAEQAAVSKYCGILCQVGFSVVISMRGNPKYDWPTWVRIDNFLQRLGFELDVCMTVAVAFAETQATWNKLRVPSRFEMRSVSLAHAVREALLQGGYMAPVFLTHVHLLPTESAEYVLHWLCCTGDSDDLTRWFFDKAWHVSLSDSERKDIEARVRAWRTWDGRTVWQHYVTSTTLPSTTAHHLTLAQPISPCVRLLTHVPAMLCDAMPSTVKRPTRN